MKQESFRAQLADYILSGRAYLHCPTTERTRFLAGLKALAEFLPDDGRQVFVWSHATGWRDVDGDTAKSTSGAEFGQPDPVHTEKSVLLAPQRLTRFALLGQIRYDGASQTPN